MCDVAVCPPALPPHLAFTATAPSPPPVDVAVAAGAGGALGVPVVTHDWSSLPYDCLSMVLPKLDARDLIACTCVCAEWRRSVHDDKVLLGKVYPANAPEMSTPELRLRARAAKSETFLPMVVKRGAEVGGNLHCILMAARMTDCGSRGFRFWRLAAKKEHVEAGLRVGEIYYMGTHNQGRDAEMAEFFLQRALKIALAASPSPASMTAAERMRVGRGCLLKAFLHLDGEGVREDAQEATRWFKLASEHGNADADRQLSTLYSTGMYGSNFGMWR